MTKIEYYQDSAGQWRWRLKARNGRIIADGAEGYSSKYAVQRAVANLQVLAITSSSVEVPA